jgi:hypothetical protein
MTREKGPPWAVQRNIMRYTLSLVVSGQVTKRKEDVAAKDLADVSKGLVLWAQAQRLEKFELWVATI